MTGLAYVVIVEPDRQGPFYGGEIIVGGYLPGTGVREIGGMGRKPLKWDCKYEVFDSPADAAERAAELAYHRTPEWVTEAIRDE